MAVIETYEADVTLNGEILSTEVSLITTVTTEGTNNHAELDNLEYQNSGHTGFEPARGEDDNYMTDAEKLKLAGIEAGAEVNNISDTNATDLTDGGETNLHTHSYDDLNDKPSLDFDPSGTAAGIMQAHENAFEHENIPITIPIDESILQGVTVIYNGDYYKTINDVDANFTPADHPELFKAFVYGDDARLTDARTPTAHKSTHATGGTDALSPSDIGAKADFTVNADTTPVDTDEVISQRGGSWLRTTYTNFKVFLAAWLLLGIKTTKIYPAVDGTTAVQFKKANDGTLIFSVDTTNGSILASGATPDASYFLNIPALNILSNICVAIALRGNSLNTKDTNTDLYITTRTVGRKVYTDRHFESITAKIGSSTNNSEFEADGTLKMNGDATVWDDLDFPLIIKTTGAGLPARTLISGNVYGYTYAVNDSLDIDSTELAHKFKQGATTGKFHVHILTNGVDASNRYVRFNFEYLAANINGVMAGTTVGAVDLLIPANTPDRTHLIFDIGDYTTLNIGSQILGKFSRVASVGTAPTNNPFVLKLQLHAEIDTIGSRQITTK